MVKVKNEILEYLIVLFGLDDICMYVYTYRYICILDICLLEINLYI